MKKIIALLFAVFVSFLCFSCEKTSTNITTFFSSQPTESTESSTGSPLSTTTTTTTVTSTPELTTIPTTTTTKATTTTVPVDSKSRALSPTKNYILMDAGTALDLSKCQYTTPAGTLILSNLALSETPTGFKRNGYLLTVSNEGFYFIAFNYNQTTIPIVLIAKAATDTEYVLFQDSYTGLPDGAIPSTYTLDVGTASITNGRMVLDGIASNLTRVLLPSYLGAFENYVIETDIIMSSASDPTRWASVLFRYADGKYFQMAFRQNATALNGVEFAKWLNGSTWTVTNQATYTEVLNPAKSYHLRIEVCGDTVNEYIDGTLLISVENANDLVRGNIGFQAKGAIAAYESVSVIMPMDYADIASANLTKISTLYTPDTGISMPPSVINWVKNINDLRAASQAIRPQILLMNINASLEVLSSESLPISSLLDALKLIDGRVIPAFYCNDITTAENLAIRLRQYGVVEAFLLSKDPKVISKARSKSQMIRGILVIEYDDHLPQLTEAELLEIRNSVNISGAIAALLPKEYAVPEAIDFLQKRLVTVYADTLTAEQNTLYNIILAGIDGVVSDGLDTVYNFLALFPDNSILRHPLLISHRGMGYGAPENSIEGALLAYAGGADVIELDIHLTTDGRLVVIHDDTTERTANTSRGVEISTLAQLKELVLKDSTGNFPDCRIPALDEYFAAFKGLDVLLFIEIKSPKAEIVPVLDALIDQYEFSSQTVIISKTAAQLIAVREQIPEVSTGYLNSAITSLTNLSGSILSVLNMTCPLKSTYNPENFQLTSEFMMQLHYRGLSSFPWTLDTPSELRRYFQMDVGGLTTGIQSILADDPWSFEVSQSDYVVSLATIDSHLNLLASTETFGGVEASCTPKWIVLDDGGTGIIIDSSAHVTNFTAVGTAYILVYHQDQFADGKTYALFDEIVTIQVTE